MKIYIENSKGYFACDDGHIYRNGVKLKGASSGTKVGYRRLVVSYLDGTTKRHLIS